MIKYSRADQILDGQLLDVSSLARGVGFKLPVGVTIGAHFKTIEASKPAIQLERMIQLLRHAYTALYRERGGRVEFIYGGCSLALILDDGDDFKPVITIFLKGEDE
jgi:hypothetical protein